MLFGRIVILLVGLMSDVNTFVYTFFFALYLVLTELGPFGFIVYSMRKRLNVYRKSQQIILD